MPMFGSSKRNVFKPTAYGSTRRARRIPRWVVLMLTGIVLGAGGLLFLQKSYGPTRLTVEQSEQLHFDLNSANLDKQRLQSQLNQQTHDLGEAKSTLSGQTTQLAQAREQIAKQQKDIQLFVGAMPPDPRGTSPGIRAADFKNNDSKLDYQILVMQDANKITNFQGDMELVVAGRYANGKHNTVTIPAVPVDLKQYAFIRGEAELPQGLAATQVTIRILNRDTKKLIATRIIRVSR